MTDLQGAKQQCLMFKNIFISIHLLFRKSGSKGNLLKEFSSFFGNPSFFLFPFGIFHRSFLCLLRQRDKLRNFHSLSKRFSSPSVCHLTGAQFYNLFWKCAPAICLKSNCCGKTAWNLAQTNWTLVESSHSNQSLYIEAFIHKPCKLVAKSRKSRIPIFTWPHWVRIRLTLLDVTQVCEDGTKSVDWRDRQPWTAVEMFRFCAQN